MERSPLELVAHSDISAATLKALGHPTRIQLLGLLRRRPHAVGEMAASLSLDPRGVAYHARKLADLGIIAEMSASGQRADPVYRLVTLPHTSDATWDAIPEVSKRVLAAAMVNQMYATAIAAIPHGAFDRREMHITRTSGDVDEATWVAISEELMATLGRVDSLMSRGRARVAAGRPAVNATVQMMLFDATVPEVAAKPSRVESLAHELDETLARIYAVCDDLGRTLIGPSPDLDDAVRQVDELRVLLQVVRRAEREGGPALADAR